MQRNVNFSQKSRILEEKVNRTYPHLFWCHKWDQRENYKDKSTAEPSQYPKKRNADDNNLATNGELYLKLDKIIGHLLDSSEGKARCSLHKWVGIETQKDVMHCLTCNITSVYCVTVNFIIMLIFAKMEESIKNKIQKF